MLAGPALAWQAVSLSHGADTAMRRDLGSIGGRTAKEALTCVQSE